MIWRGEYTICFDGFIGEKWWEQCYVVRRRGGTVAVWSLSILLRKIQCWSLLVVSRADGNYYSLTNNMLSAAWIVSIAVLSVLSLQLVEGFACRRNFIGISSVGTDARRRSQLHMNLPGQVSKKVIVTGAGKFYTCVYVHMLHTMHMVLRCNIFFVYLSLSNPITSDILIIYNTCTQHW